MNDPRKSYVYALKRPWDGVPCYIGMGTGGRAASHQKQNVNHPNDRLARVFREAGATPLTVEKIWTGLTKAEAAALEIDLIFLIGREDQGRGPLCNRSIGGQGVTGVDWTADMRSAHSLRMSDRMRNKTEAELRAYQSSASSARWARDGAAERASTRVAERMSRSEERANCSEKMKTFWSIPGKREEMARLTREGKARKKAALSPEAYAAQNAFRGQRTRAGHARRKAREAALAAETSSKGDAL